MSQAQPHSGRASPSPSPLVAAKPADVPEQDAGAQASGLRLACVDSSELFRGQKTVEISHNGSTYRLQATRLGKLILTK